MKLYASHSHLISLMFSIGFSFICCVTFSQSRNVNIINASSGEPIQYAHIYNSNFHAISDLNGSFNVGLNVRDSVTITCIGFESKQLIIDSQVSEIMLEESSLLLNPVVISEATPAEILFRIVDNMISNKQQTDRTGEQRFLFYENDTLKSCELRNWQLTDGVITAGLMNQSNTLYTFLPQLNFFRSIKELMNYNQLSPPLGALRRNNEDMWHYSLNRIHDDTGTEDAIIVADFLSANDEISHRYYIWVNLSKSSISKIEFHYQWNNNQFVSKGTGDNVSVNLRQINGQIIFEEYVQVFYGIESALDITSGLYPNKSAKSQQQVQILSEHNFRPGDSGYYKDVFSDVDVCK